MEALFTALTFLSSYLSFLFSKFFFGGFLPNEHQKIKTAKNKDTERAKSISTLLIHEKTKRADIAGSVVRRLS